MKAVRKNRQSEKGYLLLAVMLLITVMLIFLSIEAPRVAQQIQREKEEELVHRGQEYAIAIRKFFHKNGNFPTSLEQLEDTNHIRYIRKRYKDPITGESNWKLVHAGEAEIPLPKPGGVPGGGPGTLQGSAGGGNTQPGPNNTAGVNPNPGGLSSGTTLGGQPGQAPGGQLGSLKTSNIGNGPTIGGGGIIGVASVSKKTGIKEFNDKDEYDQWYFVYDPRLEQSVAVFGGSATAGILVAAPRAGGAGTAGDASNPGGSASPSPTPVQQSH